MHLSAVYNYMWNLIGALSLGLVIGVVSTNSQYGGTTVGLITVLVGTGGLTALEDTDGVAGMLLTISLVAFMAGAIFGIQVNGEMNIRRRQEAYFDITRPSSKDEPDSATPTEDEPDSAAPTEDEPDSAAPTEDEPDSAAPTEDEPDSATPTEDEPDSAAPTEDEPDSAAPTEDEPDSAAPTEDEPDSAAPTEDEPDSATPTEDEPDSATPTEDEPDSATPTEDEPDSATPTEHVEVLDGSGAFSRFMERAVQAGKPIDKDEHKWAVFAGAEPDDLLTGAEPDDLLARAEPNVHLALPPVRRVEAQPIEFDEGSHQPSATLTLEGSFEDISTAVEEKGIYLELDSHEDLE
jgi:hypothetical protein